MNTLLKLNHKNPCNLCNLWLKKPIRFAILLPLLFALSTCAEKVTYQSQFDQDDLIPVFNPPGGTYHNEQYVNITTKVEGATIRFTLDGSVPTDSSTVYSDSIYVSVPTTIRAKASKTGWDTKSEKAEYILQTAAPTFDPPAGDYDAPVFVEIICETAQATIRYTIDGSDPDTSSFIYSEPILVNRETALKAKAFREGWLDSQFATATYRPVPVATPTFTPPGGDYTTPQIVTIDCATEDATIRYTTNGTVPDSTSSLYSDPIAVNVNTNIKARAFKNDWSNTSQSEYNFIVANPTLNPQGGEYDEPQKVTINCDTAGAIIRYTTDGNGPDSSSSIYTEPIDVNVNTTLKARAFKDGWTSSLPIQAEYSFTVASPSFNPPGGLYHEPQRVAINCTTGGATIRYTTDGNEPTLSSSLYDLPINVPLGTIIKAKAFKDGWNDSQTESSHYKDILEWMVLVEGGTFNPAVDYTVTLSSFYMAKYEVTQAEYQSVMGTNPSDFSGISNRPVERISWFNAIEYCNRLSIREGLPPVYSYLAHGTNPDNWPSGWNTGYNYTNVSCNWTADGYRLPTEMEWEFAARGGVPAQNAGTFNDHWAGTDLEAELGNYAWYSANAGWDLPGGSDHLDFGTHPVGAKLPNELGLYDMSGNVWNWVWDLRADYPSGSYNDPTGPSSGDGQVIRGGSWYSTAANCYVSYRHDFPAGIRSRNCGFRICRILP